MSDEPADYAQLTRPDAEQRAGAPPVFVLTVPRWTDTATKGLHLRLWECDFEGAPDPTYAAAKLRQPTEPRTLIVDLTLDLVSNDSKNANLDLAAPVGWTITKPKVKAGKANVLGTTSVPRPGKREKVKTTGTSQGADLTLLVGNLRFHLKVPDADGFLDEGLFYEIGWELSDAKGEHRWERVADTHCVVVLAPDALKAMRGLSTKPRGALIKDANGKALASPFVPPGEPMGRFGDPTRKPSVAPANIDKLDDLIKAQVEAARADAAALADADGLRFELLLKKGEARRKFVERFATENATVKAAREGASKTYPLHLTDIRKAYFVVHDIGIPPNAARGKDHYGEEPWGKKSVAGEHVHGFLNHNGTLAVSRDFASPGGPATVYENLREGGWCGDYGIAIECVPIATTKAFREYERERAKGNTKAKRPKGTQTTFDGYADADYACEGRVGDVTYRWTHALLDALADLYVFASARAGHLLTVTGHVEMDRNLILAETFFEYSKADVKGFTGYYEKHRNQAKDVHGDPYGLDLQVFYEKITKRLNALGGLQLPARTRYGVNPRRITTRDGDTIGQSFTAVHSFPYQSSEAIYEMTREQARETSKRASSIRPIYEDGPNGRKVVTGFKGTPFWDA